MIGHASIRLIRLLLGLRVYLPRTGGSSEGNPTCHGLNAEPNNEPVPEGKNTVIQKEASSDAHDSTCGRNNIRTLIRTTCPVGSEFTDLWIIILALQIPHLSQT